MVAADVEGKELTVAAAGEEVEDLIAAGVEGKELVAAGEEGEDLIDDRRNMEYVGEQWDVLELQDAVKSENPHEVLDRSHELPVAHVSQPLEERVLALDASDSGADSDEDFQNQLGPFEGTGNYHSADYRVVMESDVESPHVGIGDVALDLVDIHGERSLGENCRDVEDHNCDPGADLNVDPHEVRNEVGSDIVAHNGVGSDIVAHNEEDSDVVDPNEDHNEEVGASE